MIIRTDTYTQIHLVKDLGKLCTFHADAYLNDVMTFQ